MEQFRPKQDNLNDYLLKHVVSSITKLPLGKFNSNDLEPVGDGITIQIEADGRLVFE